MKWFFGAVGVCFLIMLLSPAMTPGGKQSAMRTQCLSNVKQQAVALQMYADDYDLRFPNRDAWMDATLPYSKYETPLLCPEVGKLKDPQLIGYCFNGQLSNAKLPADLATTPLVFESTNMARNASGGLDSLPSPGRHHGKNSVAYVDGHAKPVKTP